MICLEEEHKCQDCPDRYPACHDHCKWHKLRQEKNNFIKEQRGKFKDTGRAIKKPVGKKTPYIRNFIKLGKY